MPWPSRGLEAQEHPWYRGSARGRGWRTGIRILHFAGLQTNRAACLESFCVSGTFCPRLPGCPRGAGTGHSPAHAGAAREGKAASLTDSRLGLETAPGARSPHRGAPSPPTFPVSWAGPLMSQGTARSCCGWGLCGAWHRGISWGIPYRWAHGVPVPVKGVACAKPGLWPLLGCPLCGTPRNLGPWFLPLALVPGDVTLLLPSAQGSHVPPVASRPSLPEITVAGGGTCQHCA